MRSPTSRKQASLKRRAVNSRDQISLARWFRPDGYIFEIRVVDARGKIDAVFS
jgi:hypothetical protein